MDRKELFDYCDDWFGKKCEGFTLSSSAKYKIWRKYQAGASIDMLFEKTFNIIKVKNNYPFYWIDNGATPVDAKKYASTPKRWDVCNLCRTIFEKSAGYKTCCCKDHYNQYRQEGYLRLSNSRKLYNCKDPSQYANRHGVSIEEATAIIEKRNCENSHRRVEYWVARGYTEADALKNISILQSKVSPMSVLYWESKGLTKEESIIARREYQSISGKQNKIKNGDLIKTFSTWCVEYWVARGKTVEEATTIIQNNSKMASQAYLNNASEQTRRENNHFCKEYYVKRFPDTWEKEYEISFGKRLGNTFRSQIADRFFERLDSKFAWLNSNRYFGDAEFTVYQKEFGRVMCYDYVDTKLKIVVEFNGDYWHANPLKYKPDDVIQFPNCRTVTASEIWDADFRKNKIMEDKGYRVFVVWEHDITLDESLIIEQLYLEIMNESN